jgi:hypothetical protein
VCLCVCVCKCLIGFLSLNGKIYDSRVCNIFHSFSSVIGNQYKIATFVKTVRVVNGDDKVLF